MCVEGAAKLYAYCEKHKIPHKRVGKLIVATSPIEVERLHALYDRGLQNKVPGLCLVSRDEMKQISPHCEGLEAIWSPNTGIVNYPDVVRSILYSTVLKITRKNKQVEPLLRDQDARGNIVTNFEGRVLVLLGKRSSNFMLVTDATSRLENSSRCGLHSD